MTESLTSTPELENSLGRFRSFRRNGGNRPTTAVHGVLGQGPLADQLAVVRPMLFIWPVLTLTSGLFDEDARNQLDLFQQ